MVIEDPQTEVLAHTINQTHVECDKPEETHHLDVLLLILANVLDIYTLRILLCSTEQVCVGCSEFWQERLYTREHWEAYISVCVGRDARCWIAGTYVLKEVPPDVYSCHRGQMVAA